MSVGSKRKTTQELFITLGQLAKATIEKFPGTEATIECVLQHPDGPRTVLAKMSLINFCAELSQLNFPKSD